MKHALKALFCVLGCLALGTSPFEAQAVSSDTPYAAIVDRNVFGLKPPPPPAPDPASIKPPPPKITLLGITTLLGKKRALLKTTPPGKPGEASKEQSYMLAEGQRDGDIEVIHVDEKAATVTVDDFGTVTNLTFDKDSLKNSGAPPAIPGVPGSTPPPSLPLPTPLAQPTPALRTIPTRSLRTPQAATPTPSTGMAYPGAMPTAYSSSAAAQPNQQQPALSPDESALMIEAQREATKDDPNAPPLPITHLTPSGARWNTSDSSGAESGTSETAAPSSSTPSEQPVHRRGFTR